MNPGERLVKVGEWWTEYASFLTIIAIPFAMSSCLEHGDFAGYWAGWACIGVGRYIVRAHYRAKKQREAYLDLLAKVEVPKGKWDTK